MLPIPPGIMASHDGALSGQDSSQAEMMSEMCILVDSSDGKIGSDTKLNCHFGSGILHRAFSVLLFNGEGKMLVQQRSHDKITFPSIWANSCCSHPLDIPGENGDPAEGAINAARRKLSQAVSYTHLTLPTTPYV